MNPRKCSECGRDAIPKKPLVWDQNSLRVAVGGKVVDVENQQFLVLRRLIEAKGRILTSRELRDSAAMLSGLNVVMCRLRKKIGTHFIVNVSRVGYRLTGAVEERDLS